MLRAQRDSDRAAFVSAMNRRMAKAESCLSRSDMPLPASDESTLIDTWNDAVALVEAIVRDDEVAAHVLVLNTRTRPSCSDASFSS
jgi:hypothetical protein